MFAKIDFETTCVTGHAKTRKARKNAQNHAGEHAEIYRSTQKSAEERSSMPKHAGGCF